MSQVNTIISKQTVALVILVAYICCLVQTGDAKLLGGRRSRFYDDGPSMGGPYGGVPTGERAILTVRGVRNPYDGSAPQKIAIEDNPYRGPFPRGVYDRQESAYGGMRTRLPMYPQSDYGYNSGYGGYGPMFGAPSRIAVTGAYPYGYGSRGF